MPLNWRWLVAALLGLWGFATPVLALSLTSDSWRGRLVVAQSDALKPKFGKSATPAAPAEGELPWSCQDLEDTSSWAIQQVRCLRDFRGSAYGKIASERGFRLFGCDRIAGHVWGEVAPRLKGAKTFRTYHNLCGELIRDVESETGIDMAADSCLLVFRGGAEGWLPCLDAVAESRARLLDAVEACATTGNAALLDDVNQVVGTIDWDRLGRQALGCGALVAVGIEAGLATEASVAELRQAGRAAGTLRPTSEEVERAYWQWLEAHTGCGLGFDEECRFGPDLSAAGARHLARSIEDSANWVFEQNGMSQRMSGDLLAVFLAVSDLYPRVCSAGARVDTYSCQIEAQVRCRVSVGAYAEMERIMSAGVCPQLTYQFERVELNLVAAPDGFVLAQ